MKIEERLVKIAEEDLDSGRMIGQVNVPQLIARVPTPSIEDVSDDYVEIMHGKVGDIYWFRTGKHEGTGLVFRSDRISAFNVVLPSLVPNKGLVLQSLTRWWIDELGITYAAGGQYVDPNAIHARRTEVAPVELIIRKLFGGSGHKHYHQLPMRWDGKTPDDSKPWSPEHNRFFQNYGIMMAPHMFIDPRAMAKDGKIAPWAELKMPIATPTEKSHDDPPLTHEKACEIMGKFYYESAVEYGMDLFMVADEILRGNGILMADTKLEFSPRGLVDEIFTPDSSRFYPEKSWAEFQEATLAGRKANLTQAFSKEIVREWLSNSGNEGKAAALPRELIVATSAGYMQAYEMITGSRIEEIIGDRSVSIQGRINANVEKFLRGE